MTDRKPLRPMPEAVVPMFKEAVSDFDPPLTKDEKGRLMRQYEEDYEIIPVAGQQTFNALVKQFVELKLRPQQ